MRGVDDRRWLVYFADTARAITAAPNGREAPLNCNAEEVPTWTAALPPSTHALIVRCACSSARARRFARRCSTVRERVPAGRR